MSLSEIQAFQCLCNVFIHLLWAYVASQFVNRLFDLVQDIHLQRPTQDPEEDPEDDESEEEVESEEDESEEEEEDPKDPGSEEEESPKASEENETQEPATEAPWRPLIQ